MGGIVWVVVVCRSPVRVVWGPGWRAEVLLMIPGPFPPSLFGWVRDLGVGGVSPTPRRPKVFSITAMFLILHDEFLGFFFHHSHIVL